jgi:hypothetical protein
MMVDESRANVAKTDTRINNRFRINEPSRLAYEATSVMQTSE